MSKSNELPSKWQEETVLPKTKAKTASFTQISNDILLDERLSFKARGILALLLSRPKNWKIYIDEIVERSTADGKHSVRTGFKELKEFGYLELVKIWNKKTGKFEGTVYQLCRPNPPKSPTQKNLPEPKDFLTTKKTDVPKISKTENLSVEKTDRPKTMIPSNTNSSNTKYSNTEIKQQQTKVDDDVFLRNLENEKRFSKENIENQSATALLSPVATEVSGQAAASAAVISSQTAVPSTRDRYQNATTLLPFLENDDVWKKQFVGKDICKQIGTTEILTLPVFDLLLKHFTQTSISSGATYHNITAIKRHFFNWFNANLKKGALPNYIEQQTVAPKKVRNQVAALMPKTDAILNKIYGQKCENEAHLYRCLQLLETHLAIYENALNFLDSENQTAVNTWILDIENAKNLVERGRKAGQLYWFCKRTSKLQLGNKPKPKTSIKSVMLSEILVNQQPQMAQHE